MISYLCLWRVSGIAYGYPDVFMKVTEVMRVIPETRVFIC